MELSEYAEEILEKLWIQTQEKHITPDWESLRNTSGFPELVDSGFLEKTGTGENSYLLTRSGLDESKQCVRRHRLAERFLADVLRTRGTQVHETGCRLEHIIKKGIEDSICTLLGHPDTCPHGSPIPRGLCCTEQAEITSRQNTFSLAQAEPGKTHSVAYIRTSETDQMKKIIAMGIVPSIMIQLLRRFPAFVFRIGNSLFAIDREIAGEIIVWKDQREPG